MKPLVRVSRFIFLLLLTKATSLQAQQFRFAWLSDTHVGTATGAADLGLSVRDINTMDDVAFVILSGDITEMGFDAQLDLTKSILDSLKKPYYILPGNHDTKWSPSGCTKFSSIWGGDKFVFQYGGFRFIGLHEGPIMKMGDGHFPPEDLRWLDSVLTSIPNNKQPLFLVTHYPLEPQIDNWYTLTERLKHYNTQAVLVGHGHDNRVMNFEGIPGIMGRSNLRAGKPYGGYTIADVKADTIFFTEKTPGVPLKNPWHKVALGQRDFSKDTATYARPVFSVNQLFKGTVARWTVNTGYTIASTPVVWKDYVVVGNSSGMVSCYSLNDGSPLWSFKTGSTVYSTPDAADDKVVLGSSDKNIYCLDIKTGKLIWKVTTGNAVVAAATIKEGTAYVGGSDGVFRAIDLQSGSLRWECRGVSGFVETKPLIYKGKVIFGAWDTYLYALDTKDGSVVWKWTNGNPGVLYSPAACWPVAADGKVFIAAPDRYMTAIDAENGSTVWRTNRYRVRECVGLSQDGQRVYARCMTDTVVAFSPMASSPSTVWVASCGYGYDIDPSMPLEQNGIVEFGTKNGFVFGLDGKSGKVLWEHRVGVTIVNTPVPVDDHRLIVSDLDGVVSLLEFR